jgi:hypothetical protein
MKFVVFALSIILLACTASSTASSQPSVGQIRQSLLTQSPPVLDDQDQSTTTGANQNPLTGAQRMELSKLNADFQLKLTVLVSIFGIIGLIFVAWLFRSSVTADTEKIVRLVIVVIVVTASLILIAGGYSTDQTAPAFGLFGSIIGYILGSANRGAPGNTPTNGDAPATGNAPPTDNTVAPAVNKT